MLLPAAAGFLRGLVQALGQRGSSSVVTNGTTTIVQQSGKGITQGAFQGAAQAGQTLSEYFQNQANNVQPLVRVAAGTPMGLFFITSVKDQTEISNPILIRPICLRSREWPVTPTVIRAMVLRRQPGNYYPGMALAGYNGQQPPTGTTTAAEMPAPLRPIPNSTDAL